MTSLRSLQVRGAGWRGMVFVAALLCARSACAMAPDVVLIQPRAEEPLAGTITAQWLAGVKAVKVAPGTYRVAAPGEDAPMTFRDVSNFEIDAGGVTFIFTEPRKGGFVFERCRNLTLRGATIRFEPLPFTQGRIAEIASDGTWYELVIDRGYLELDNPDYFSERPVSYVIDPQTRRWKAGMVDLRTC